ncbi:MAG: MtnX-like HAD-IB family phosphatase [Bacilli bacterium]
MTIKIFCDFDGTITTTENMVTLINKFVSPELQETKKKIYNKEISIRTGVETMFHSIPSSELPAMVNHVLDTAIFRPGWETFLDYIKKQDVEFYVVSGGFTFFIEPLLKNAQAIDGIFANEIDASNPFLTVNWPYACEAHCSNDCGLCKVKVMEQHSTSADFTIVIGDSITDLQAAKKADVVFARDFLIKCCRNDNIPFYEFRTFHDIIEQLEKLPVEVGQ